MSIRDIMGMLSEFDDDELMSLCVDTFAQNLIQTQQCASLRTGTGTSHGDA